MKINKVSITFSRSLVLLCLYAFAFTSCRSDSQFLISQLQEQPLSLPVSVFQQSRSTSCGEAVIAMTYNFIHPDRPLTEQEVIEYALANGYFDEVNSPFTSPANMVKIAEHYAEDVSSGRVSTPGQGLSLLFENLRDGVPVVIDVHSNFSDPESEAHFIVVTGLSVDASRENALLVHYNDPLTGTQQTADWLGDEGLWNAWITNNDPGGPGWWLVIAPS
ncbi:MAG TPA: papain-like cysteine protease family protein [Anaerolineales bacterium]|nr:papain-like cysteine protease family protein [Anaerolineales bacterium]